MIEDQKYAELEAQLRRARRKSWLRFFIFLGFVLALWVTAYVVTKGQFSFFAKRIEYYRDTLVINQDSALAARDRIIADQDSLIKILQKDNLHSISNPATATRPVITENLLSLDIIKRRKLLRERDSLLKLTRQQTNYEPNNNNFQNQAPAFKK